MSRSPAPSGGRPFVPSVAFAPRSLLFPKRQAPPEDPLIQRSTTINDPRPPLPLPLATPKTARRSSPSPSPSTPLRCNRPPSSAAANSSPASAFFLRTHYQPGKKLSQIQKEGVEKQLKLLLPDENDGKSKSPADKKILNRPASSRSLVHSQSEPVLHTLSPIPHVDVSSLSYRRSLVSSGAADFPAAFASLFSYLSSPYCSIFSSPRLATLGYAQIQSLVSLTGNSPVAALNLINRFNERQQRFDSFPAFLTALEVAYEKELKRRISGLERQKKIQRKLEQESHDKFLEESRLFDFSLQSAGDSAEAAEILQTPTRPDGFGVVLAAGKLKSALKKRGSLTMESPNGISPASFYIDGILSHLRSPESRILPEPVKFSLSRTQASNLLTLTRVALDSADQLLALLATLERENASFGSWDHFSQEFTQRFRAIASRTSEPPESPVAPEVPKPIGAALVELVDFLCSPGCSLLDWNLKRRLIAEAEKFDFSSVQGFSPLWNSQRVEFLDPQGKYIPEWAEFAAPPENPQTSENELEAEFTENPAVLLRAASLKRLNSLRQTPDRPPPSAALRGCPSLLLYFLHFLSSPPVSSSFSLVLLEFQHSNFHCHRFSSVSALLNGALEFLAHFHGFLLPKILFFLQNPNLRLLPPSRQIALSLRQCEQIATQSRSGSSTLAFMAILAEQRGFVKSSESPEPQNPFHFPTVAALVDALLNLSDQKITESAGQREEILERIYQTHGIRRFRCKIDDSPNSLDCLSSLITDFPGLLPLPFVDQPLAMALLSLGQPISRLLAILSALHFSFEYFSTVDALLKATQSAAQRLQQTLEQLFLALSKPAIQPPFIGILDSSCSHQLNLTVCERIFTDSRAFFAVLKLLPAAEKAAVAQGAGFSSFDPLISVLRLSSVSDYQHAAEKIVKVQKFFTRFSPDLLGGPALAACESWQILKLCQGDCERASFYLFLLNDFQRPSDSGALRISNEPGFLNAAPPFPERCEKFSELLAALDYWHSAHFPALQRSATEFALEAIKQRLGMIQAEVQAKQAQQILTAIFQWIHQIAQPLGESSDPADFPLTHFPSFFDPLSSFNLLLFLLNTHFPRSSNDSPFYSFASFALAVQTVLHNERDSLIRMREFLTAQRPLIENLAEFDDFLTNRSILRVLRESRARFGALKILQLQKPTLPRWSVEALVNFLDLAHSRAEEALTLQVRQQSECREFLLRQSKFLLPPDVKRELTDFPSSSLSWPSVYSLLLESAGSHGLLMEFLHNFDRVQEKFQGIQEIGHRLREAAQKARIQLGELLDFLSDSSCFLLDKRVLVNLIEIHQFLQHSRLSNSAALRALSSLNGKVQEKIMAPFDSLTALAEACAAHYQTFLNSRAASEAAIRSAVERLWPGLGNSLTPQEIEELNNFTTAFEENCSQATLRVRSSAGGIPMENRSDRDPLKVKQAPSPILLHLLDSLALDCRAREAPPPALLHDLRDLLARLLADFSVLDSQVSGGFFFSRFSLSASEFDFLSLYEQVDCVEIVPVLNSISSAEMPGALGASTFQRLLSSAQRRAFAERQKFSQRLALKAKLEKLALLSRNCLSSVSDRDLDSLLSDDWEDSMKSLAAAIVRPFEQFDLMLAALRPLKARVSSERHLKFLVNQLLPNSPDLDFTHLEILLDACGGDSSVALSALQLLAADQARQKLSNLPQAENRWNSFADLMMAVMEIARSSGKRDNNNQTNKLTEEKFRFGCSFQWRSSEAAIPVKISFDANRLSLRCDSRPQLNSSLDLHDLIEIRRGEDFSPLIPSGSSISSSSCFILRAGGFSWPLAGSDEKFTSDWILKVKEKCSAVAQQREEEKTFQQRTEQQNGHLSNAIENGKDKRLRAVYSSLGDSGLASRFPTRITVEEDFHLVTRPS